MNHIYGKLYLMVVPQDYSGAETFLMPTDIVAIITS